MCIDSFPNELFDILDEMNIKFKGYFFVTSVGFIKPFYYPKIFQKIKNFFINDFEFSWNDVYYLEEKMNFSSEISKLMYKDYINKMTDDINNLSTSFINTIYQIAINTEPNYYYKNGIKLNFSLYPI